MKTSEFEEVKKWLRGLRVSVKTLNLKIEFYNSLIKMSEKSKYRGAESDIGYYNNEIGAIEAEIKSRVNLFERCLDILEEKEKNIITLKYMNGIGWDYISMKAYYSKTQAIRIHNSAVRKIVNNRDLYKKLINGNKKGGEEYEQKVD